MGLLIMWHGSHIFHQKSDEKRDFKVTWSIRSAHYMILFRFFKGFSFYLDISWDSMIQFFRSGSRSSSIPFNLGLWIFSWFLVIYWVIYLHYFAFFCNLIDHVFDHAPSIPFNLGLWIFLWFLVIYQVIYLHYFAFL